MAGDKLTLSVVINLIKGGFEKGAKEVTRSVDNLRAKFVSFFAVVAGGAYSLTALVRSLKDTALANERIRVSLKNVTDGSSDFVRSQQFLLKVSKQYGQDLIALSNGYIGFTAAARQANMPISEQEKIFESLTKASATYGLSSERTSLVMLALSQMMSKGKISAEELRRQMGEHLPIAYMAMARASGLTTAQFEKMMSQGKILSADILPKFAEELNKATEGADFDNYITSWAKLKNEFTTFVGQLDLPKLIKPVIDFLTSVLKGISNNVRAVIGALTAGILSLPINRAWQNAKKLHSEISASAKKLEQDLLLTNRRIADAEARIARERLQLEKATRDAEVKEGEVATLKQEAAIKRKAQAEARIKEQELAVTRLTEQKKAQEVELANAKQVSSTMRTTSTIKTLWASAVASIKSLWLGVKAMISSSIIGLIATSIGALLGKVADLISKAREAHKLALEVQASLERSDAERRRQAVGSLSNAEALLGEQIEVLEQSSDPEAKASARAVLRQNFMVEGADDAELLRNAKHAHNIQLAEKELSLLDADLARAYEQVKSTEHIGAKKFTPLVRYKDKEGKDHVTYKGESTFEEEYQRRKAYLESAGGVADVNTLLSGKGLPSTAPFSPVGVGSGADFERYVKAQHAKEQLQELYNAKASEVARLKAGGGLGATTQGGEYNEAVETAKANYLKDKQALIAQRDAGVLHATGGSYEQELSQISVTLAKELLNALGVEGAKADSMYQEATGQIIAKQSRAKSSTRGSDTEADKIAEAERGYIASLQRLSNQYQAGVLDEEQYNSERAKVSKDYITAVAGLAGAGATSIKSYQDASQIVAEHSDEYKRITAEVCDTYAKLTQKLADGHMSEQEYFSQLGSLVNSTIDRIYSSGAVTDAEREYIQALKSQQGKLQSEAYDSPDSVSRAGTTELDNTLVQLSAKTHVAILPDIIQRLKQREEELQGVLGDILTEAGGIYSQEDLDALRAKLGEGELPIAELEKLYTNFSEKLVNDLNKAMASTSNISKGIKIAEARTEVAKNEKRIQKGGDGWGRFKEMASSTQRLTRSLKTLREVMENPDTSAWEKMLNVLNAIIQMTDAIMSVGNAIKAISEAMQIASAASEAAGAISTATGTAEIATSKAVTSAKAEEMAVKTSAAYAGLPFVGVGIAAGVIGAMLALIATTAGKFATGGIVGGNSYHGDKVMAMVNSGEMILNRSQQARLFELANGRGAGSGNARQSVVVVGGSLTARGDQLRVVLRKDAERRRRL